VPSRSNLYFGAAGLEQKTFTEWSDPERQWRVAEAVVGPARGGFGGAGSYKNRHNVGEALTYERSQQRRPAFYEQAFDSVSVKRRQRPAQIMPVCRQR
jgi:hypothetical protein